MERERAAEANSNVSEWRPGARKFQDPPPEAVLGSESSHSDIHRWCLQEANGHQAKEAEASKENRAKGLVNW